MHRFCSFKVQFGRQHCVTDCPADARDGVFRYHRVEKPEDVPPPTPSPWTWPSWT